VELQRYLSIVRRYFPLMVVLTVLGGGSSAVFSLRQAKVYRATATLLINPAVPNAAIPFLSQSITNDPRTETLQLADTYDVYLKTGMFDAEVVRDLGLPLAPSVLGGALSSALIDNTNFYSISATANSGVEAALIATGVANIFIKQNRILQRTLESQATDGAQAADLRLRTTSIKKELDSVWRLDQSLTSKANLAAADQQTLASVEARISYLTDTYTTLLAQVSSGNRPLLNTATLVQAAGVPNLPIAPQTRKNVLIGTIAGLVIGVLLAFLLDFINEAVLTPEDAERATGMMPLAVIGVNGAWMRRGILGMGGRRRKPADPPDPPPLLPAHGNARGSRSSRLFALESPHDPVTEAFRTLRTNLAFSSIGQPVRTLVVTSMMPGEGKTTVAANLAVVLAQSGRRVILVDTDLRRPTLHTVFNVAKNPGFTDILLGYATASAALQHTAVPNLRVLPCGPRPSNPAELLSFPALVPLIEELEAQADLVIFDTPPMGVLTDAVLLSTRMEGTVVVIRSGVTRPGALIKGIESLKTVGARPIGTVLNMVNASEFGKYGNYYYQYYG
jgi:non-specific protein-tyrosine kinase